MPPLKPLCTAGYTSSTATTVPGSRARTHRRLVPVIDIGGKFLQFLTFLREVKDRSISQYIYGQ